MSDLSHVLDGQIVTDGKGKLSVRSSVIVTFNTGISSSSYFFLTVTAKSERSHNLEVVKSPGCESIGKALFEMTKSAL